MSNVANVDWQTTKKGLTQRGQYLLDTGIWSDCRFIVGTEPNQQVVEGHKLLLAMSSPVFQAMFFGGMAENDPIAILDVQPDAFKALLEYIYTDKINLSSFDQACELCYGAKKYMLPHLVEACTKYLWRDLTPKNACRAYEFAKLFEEPRLMNQCLKIIRCQTHDVLNDSSFEDVEISTVLTIFDQENLSVNSDLDLFSAITRYAERHNANSGNSSTAASSDRPLVRDAIKKIRFLTLSPQQFAEGPGKSDLLSQSEKFAILMNISSPSSAIDMPEGFCTNRERRRTALLLPGPPVPDKCMKERPEYGGRRLFCDRDIICILEARNSSVLDCSVSFSCDRNICIYGIQVPTQMNKKPQPTPPYPELLYAHLLDPDGSRLTYTHYTGRVDYDSTIELIFNRPIYIQKHKEYRVGVVLNRTGWYPMASYPPHSTSHGVLFTFFRPPLPENPRDGLIRSIIFMIADSSKVVDNTH